jgi:uncharacterized protein (DUF433 family)
MSEFSRISHNPAIMAGKPIVRGMRVTVGMILQQLGAGTTIDELLEHFPYLEREDILEAIAYAGEAISNPEFDLSDAN